ncbi:embryo defective [Thalictrum thalictroides]|uniref:Embryo defective n=1 Tax=Thalictrum thalictroides TaxID=46969 RepID=A0A7J6WJN0_THATH|nr:embryo defective [Thalictrum thalictroides]
MLSVSLLQTVAATSYCSSAQLIQTQTRTRREMSLPFNALPSLRSSMSSMKHKGLAPYRSLSYPFLSSGRQGLHPFQNSSPIVCCTMNMAEGESAGPRRLNLDHILGEIHNVWESLPQPVRSFPWAEALENFLEFILGLVYAVVKYLSIPLLALTSLSEMSYCAHERKMRLIPIPLLVGIAMAGIFRDTTLELYPQLKERDFPWHLVAVAVIFILLKLPGPYYPYWGRIFIPHFANGGLLRSLWFALMWYRRSPEGTRKNNTTELAK